MAQTASFKRAYLIRLYRAITTTLSDKLYSELDTLVGNAERGRALASTSAKGHSVSFLSAGEGGPDQGQMVELIDELIRLYDSANADLIASGVSSPTDAQIYAEMKDRLQPVRSFTKDFASLRC